MDVPDLLYHLKRKLLTKPKDLGISDHVSAYIQS